LLHAVARQQLAAGEVFGTGVVTAALGDARNLVAQVGDECAHGIGVGLEVFSAGVQLGL